MSLCVLYKYLIEKSLVLAISELSFHEGVIKECCHVVGLSEMTKKEREYVYKTQILNSNHSMVFISCYCSSFIPKE